MLLFLIKIQKSFDELSKGRTTLIIAHRLSTIQNADCIAVVGEKEILEMGTHQQLMEKAELTQVCINCRISNQRKLNFVFNSSVLDNINNFVFW